MATYLVASFLVFLLVDFNYMYKILDEKILYTTNGSKLKYELQKNKKQVKSKIEEYSFIDFVILIISSLITFLILFSLATYIFSVNPLNITIANRTLNLINVLGSKITEARIVYYTSAAMFSFIIVFKLDKILLNGIKRYIGEVIREDESKSIEYKTGFVIAKDENDECVEVTEDTLYKNVLITGSIGSGKTSGAVSRLIYPLIKSGKGGLIIDIKGNYLNTIENMCKRTGRTGDLKVISKNSNYYFNLLNSDDSNLEIAKKVRQIIELLASKGNSDPYWLDKVENYLQNLFVIMRYAQLEFNVFELHKLVTEETYLGNIIEKIKENALNEPPEERISFELSNAISYIKNEFQSLEERIQSIIKSEITRFTIPLITEYDIYNQFVVANNKQEIIFNSKDIIVVSIPIGENRLLAKIIATIVKLDFQKYILSNVLDPKPTFFLIDEYQEICNIQDSNFLSLSRESQCMNIISTQSYSSLNIALKDEDAAKVIIQNLVNKIWFRNDDVYTVSEITRQLGKVNVMKKNEGISESSQESKKYMFKDGFRNIKSSISKTLNYVETKEDAYDFNYFTRGLKTYEALILFLGEEGMLEPKKVIFERWG